MNSENSNRDQSLILEGAIADAMSLMDYAARHGVNVEPGILKQIETCEGKKPENLSDRERIKFWDAFTKLAEKLKPVTPSSIEYTKGINIKGFAGRRVQVPLYVMVSSLSLILLVLVQIFWIGGNSLVTDVKSNLDEVQTLQSKIIDEERLLYEGGSGELSTPAIDKLYIELRSAYAKLTSDYESLYSWNLTWSRLTFIKPPFDSPQYDKYDLPTKANVSMASAKLVLHAIHGYALPLLYGLVGACFFVLRTLSREIRSWTFTQQSSIAYLLRITLGPLAGLGAGLLVLGGGAGPNADNAATGTTVDLQALGPLALAFVAGYGVELVFALLDRIVDAFTGADK